MKILLVNKYHYVKGGSETYHFGLAKLLESHGNEVIYFAMADEKNYECEQSKYFSKNVDFNAKLSLSGKLKAGYHALYSFDAKKKIGQLIKDEKLEATEEEVDAKVAEQAASVNKTAEEYKKNMDPRQFDYIRSDIVITKLFNFLKENNEMYVEA